MSGDELRLLSACQMRKLFSTRATPGFATAHHIGLCFAILKQVLNRKQKKKDITMRFEAGLQVLRKDTICRHWSCALSSPQSLIACSFVAIFGKEQSNARKE